MRNALLAALLVTVSIRAPAIDTAELPDPAQQQRYERLIHELQCLQCQGENVADTPAQFAADIRRQVREMIQAGSSDAQIRQYLLDRYGEKILLRPPWTLANSWLWLAPGLLLLAGVIIAVRIVRQRRQLLATDTSEPGEEETHS
ncbi:MAG TPA: cytochrome c-type biogenesis protein [Steroidobacteraceae bacterium]|nr:cytochrome c-type biogenesis protein [Steroidobacteraceae bacterium]